MSIHRLLDIPHVATESLLKGGFPLVRGFVTRKRRNGEWYYYCINVRGNCGFFTIDAMTVNNASWTRRGYGLVVRLDADSKTLNTAHYANPTAKDVVPLADVPSLLNIPVSVYDQQIANAGEYGNIVLSPAEAAAWFDSRNYDLYASER